MILLIDNYDSFTYNLAQYLGQLGEKLEVHRNDQITSTKSPPRSPTASSFPRAQACRRRPASSSTSSANSAEKFPLLGVCLGHQAIGYAFGGSVIRAPEIMHGKTSRIHHDPKQFFASCRRTSWPRATTR